MYNQVRKVRSGTKVRYTKICILPIADSGIENCTPYPTRNPITSANTHPY